MAQPINGPRSSPDSQTIFGTYVSPDPNGDTWNRWVGTIGPLLPEGWGYDVSSTNQIVYTRQNASRRELWAADLR